MSERYLRWSAAAGCLAEGSRCGGWLPHVVIVGARGTVRATVERSVLRRRAPGEPRVAGQPSHGLRATLVQVEEIIKHCEGFVGRHAPHLAVGRCREITGQV